MKNWSYPLILSTLAKVEIIYCHLLLCCKRGRTERSDQQFRSACVLLTIVTPCCQHRYFLAIFNGFSDRFFLPIRNWYWTKLDLASQAFLNIGNHDWPEKCDRFTPQIQDALCLGAVVLMWSDTSTCICDSLVISLCALQCQMHCNMLPEHSFSMALCFSILLRQKVEKCVLDY